jgi:hypothetical protein
MFRHGENEARVQSLSDSAGGRVATYLKAQVNNTVKNLAKANKSALIGIGSKQKSVMIVKRGVTTIHEAR